MAESKKASSETPGEEETPRVGIPLGGFPPTREGASVLERKAETKADREALIGVLTPVQKAVEDAQAALPEGNGVWTAGVRQWLNFFGHEVGYQIERLQTGPKVL